MSVPTLDGNYLLLSYWTNQGEDRYFTIAEPLKHCAPHMHPLTHFVHEGFEVPVSASSVAELKKKLRAMLKACDRSPFQLVPERVIPPSLKE